MRVVFSGVTVSVFLLAGALTITGEQTQITARQYIPYAEARSVIEALRSNLIPEELRSKSPAERETVWRDWTSRRDQAIRARLARGDEDTVINFLLYGTTFTDVPRPSPTEVATLTQNSDDLPKLIASRVEDFMRALDAPNQSERLQFARSIIVRNGIESNSASGRTQLRQFLTEGVRRGPAETMNISNALGSAIQRNDPNATLIEQTAFRDRGLSSDTSILIDYAIEEVLKAVKAEGLVAPEQMQQVGLIGPGLDFTDKDGGYDFYPQQTIQPFALVNSLISLELAKLDEIQLTTLDLNPRINQHLLAARARARAGSPYRLVLARNLDLPWNDSLVAYWERFGDQIASPERNAAAPPPTAGHVRIRTVEVRPEIVLSVVPEDVNIVMQRIEPLDLTQRFDLIVATDVLIYYNVFEQSLALSNVAHMLRPGGLFITNNAVFLLPDLPMSEAGRAQLSYMPVPGLGEVNDQLIWYQKN